MTRSVLAGRPCDASVRRETLPFDVRREAAISAHIRFNLREIVAHTRSELDVGQAGFAQIDQMPRAELQVFSQFLLGQPPAGPLRLLMLRLDVGASARRGEASTTSARAPAIRDEIVILVGTVVRSNVTRNVMLNLLFSPAASGSSLKCSA